MSSSNIFLPVLSDWAEQRITAIYNATTETDFDIAFNAFISSKCHIIVNGKEMTREQYRQQLRREKSGESSAQVKFLGNVAVDNKARQFVCFAFYWISCLCHGLTLCGI